jgi:twitching motility protein PilT
MIEHPLQGELRLWARGLLEQEALFGKLQPSELDLLMTSTRLLECDANERVYAQGDQSKNFALLLAGSVVAMAPHPEVGGLFETEMLEAPHFIGVESMIARKPREAVVFAKERLFMLEFTEGALEKLIRGLPVFAYRLGYSLSKRLLGLNQRLKLPDVDPVLLERVNQEVLGILPVEFVEEHGVLPLGIWGNILRICFPEVPPKHVFEMIREMLPGIQIHLFRVSESEFSGILQKFGMQRRGQSVQSVSSVSGVQAGGAILPELSPGGMASPTQPVPIPPMPMGGMQPGMDPMMMGGGGQGNQLVEALLQQTAVLQQTFALQQKDIAPHLIPSYSGAFKKPKRRELTADEKRSMVSRILPLLQNMAKEGASDLHLSAKQKMRWRIDGELFEVPDSPVLGEEEVLELLGGIMKDENVAEFERYNHTDFSYELEGLARYRVNIYREGNGVSAALRQIPIHIPSMEELSLPDAVKRMAEFSQGLVLVTGPTGSGKSTTLAAMLRSINEWQRKHIITLEDPIEFVHKSDKALIHQREIGPHSPSFNAALRAALREDPDIVLVGEMRDLETMALAIETAHTGHLVFGTLHTNNVIATVDRIIDMFPSEQHNQVRGSLSEVLKGIVCQVLCKRTGRGRVGAYEVMTCNSAISNMIRSEKTHQLQTAMIGKSHLLLNQQLEDLVRKRTIDKREAIARSYDKDDMRQRLGMAADDVKKQSAILKDSRQGRGMDRLGGGADGRKTAGLSGMDRLNRGQK